MESYSSTSSRYRDASHLEHKGEFHEHKGHGSVVDQRRERELGGSAFRSAHGSPTYRLPSMGQYGVNEEEYSPMGKGQFSEMCMATSYHVESGRGKVLEDKGWLAAAMILGLLASYPLVIKPLHQVSTDMLSKMRGNLKTGAI